MIYRGPYWRALRLVALAVITAVIATSSPRPSLHGAGLVILVALVATLVAQAAGAAVPDRAPTVRAVLSGAGSGVLVGFDPGWSVALLMFAGFDAGLVLTFSPGAYVIAVAVLAEIIGTLGAGQPASTSAYSLIAVASYLAATTFRQYKLRAQEAELRLADVERAQLEHARAVSLAERANAAREIHDILAHNLGALVVQLDAADSLLSANEPRVEAALPVIRRAHRLAVSGLVEAGQAVSSLRQDAPPLIDSLRQLVETAGAATLEIVGDERAVAPEVAVVVRRTAQEAITNAAKHAPGSVPALRLELLPDALVLTVSDSGSEPGSSPAPVAATGGGYGVEGMRERARLIGAHLEAGPAGSGWQVRLTVPDRRSAP